MSIVRSMGSSAIAGSVALHESGPIHQEIFAKLLRREQTHVGADTGIGVLVKIDKATDARGKPIM